MFDEIKKLTWLGFSLLTHLPSNTLAGLWSCTVIPCRVKEGGKRIKNDKITYIMKPLSARLVLVQLVPWVPDTHITLEQCLNVSTTPITAMGCRQSLSLSVVQLKGKHWGPSKNDVTPKGEGGGYKKCPKRRRLLVDLRRQGEGGYPKNQKFGDFFYVWSLRE